VHSTEILLRHMEHKSEHCHLAFDTVYCASLNLMVKRKKNSIVQAQRKKEEFLAQQKNNRIESHVRAIVAMYECNAEKERPAPVSTTCAHATSDKDPCHTLKRDSSYIPRRDVARVKTSCHVRGNPITHCRFVYEWVISLIRATA